MYKARVYHIMIGAPSDITEEVKIVKDIVNRWNDLNSEKEKVVLLPKYWESSTYPIAGARPQASINKQIVEKSDLLISIFGARIGAPTGSSLSGSIEEIDEHLKAGKNVMVFFKQSGSYNIDLEQLKKVKDFRDSHRNDIYWADYPNVEKFKDLLFDKIQLFLNDNWLKEKDEDAYHDEEILRGADRAVSSAQHTAQFNEYVTALNILFNSLEEVLTCNDKKRAEKTVAMLIDFIHEILDVRSKQGKCRVTVGRRDHYKDLILQIGSPDANTIIKLLDSAEEVSEDYHEMDDLFDEKMKANRPVYKDETLYFPDGTKSGRNENDEQFLYDLARGK